MTLSLLMNLGFAGGGAPAGGGFPGSDNTLALIGCGRLLIPFVALWEMIRG